MLISLSLAIGIEFECWLQMIKEALLALNEKGGSSPHAIAKYMEEKHKAVLPENFRKTLALQLKNSASKGKLTKVKASYKLCESASKKKPTDAATEPKQTKSKKPAATATTGGSNKVKKAPKKSARTATAKKQATVKKAKKMTPAKPKQPKSIKSPAGKKARKATA